MQRVIYYECMVTEDKAMKNTENPSTEQLEALKAWAALYGRNWKSPLRDAWMTGDYGSFEQSNYLQQIRNTFGPSWLIRFRLPKADGLEQLRGAIEDMKFFDRVTSNVRQA